VKKTFILLFGLACILSACQNQEKTENMKNPLLSEFNTPFGVPPFDQINNEQFIPAMREAMKADNEEIDAIAGNTEEPTFENTIVALDNSGELLDQVGGVFYNLTSSLTSPELQEIEQEIAPEVSAHGDAIRLNEKLFKRIKAVYDKKADLDLNPSQAKLLDDTYKGFVRGGANLNNEDKEKLKKINEQLSLLTLQFGQNVLGQTNDYKLVIDTKTDLSGLPENVVYSAAEAAKEDGLEGKWVFTIQKPSLLPFLTYADNRDLRKELFKAYANLGNRNDQFDNKEIISKIVKLRSEKANLLGYKTHADYVLERNMAKNPASVNDLLMRLWKPAIKVAKAEAADMQMMIDRDGSNFKLEPWDWWYYAEKVRKEKYDIDESTLSQYFVLDNVRQGAFDVAHKLYGITFEPRNDVPVYHQDVEAYEVKDADGSHLGVLYMDFFPRDSKRAGAWMSEYRGQHIEDGEDIRPVVTTNFNFTKPSGDAPALLTVDEVQTTFHEFGHALHGLLSKCTYKGQAGTSVSRDFVELPSQIMENWALEPEVLRSFAKHYQTGEVIPDELIQKIQNSSHFNQGFTTVEYLAASLLDMDYHTLSPENATIKDVNVFEDSALNAVGLIPEIISRYRSPYFSHIFAGGYSSGYYSYIWAEVLDADAFQAFKETGNIFDPATATAFRTNVLEKGGTRDPMDLYVAFRGKEPGVEPLLKKRGLD